MKQKVIRATALNGKVELSKEDFLMLTKLAGVEVRDITSFSLTVPARKGPKPGTERKKPGPKKKGGKGIT